MTCDHARDGQAAVRQTVLDLARAVLAADPGRAVGAAATVPCPVCLGIAAIQFGFTLCAALAGDELFVSEQTRARLLRLIDAAQQELDVGSN